MVRGSNGPVTSLGDDTWKDYIVSADVMLDSDENAKNYAAICARYNAVQSIADNGYWLRIYQDGIWRLYSNQGKIANGKISGMKQGRFVNLKLKVLDNTVTAYINNEQVAKKQLRNHQLILAGWHLQVLITKIVLIM